MSPTLQRKLVARSRGQVMVLGAVALLVMALMLMASFSVSNAIHEKVRIQAQADAQAYSLAVLEARAFNVTSHYNRAIVATLVAQMSLHSWMAIATANVSQLECESRALWMIIGLETGLCVSGNAHCFHKAEAEFDKNRTDSTLIQWKSKLQNKEQPFNDAVKALKEMADSLHGSQNDVLSRMSGQFDTNQGVLATLKASNASASNYLGQIDGINRGEFACALEGSSIDDSCAGSHKRDKSSASDRSRVMENAANAARPRFGTQGNPPSVSPRNWNDIGSEPRAQLSHGQWSISAQANKAGVGQSWDPASDAEGKNVGARVAVSECRIERYEDSFGEGRYKGAIFSDSNGGMHQYNSQFDRNHREFKGVQMEDPCGESNCFVNFRADPDVAHDFGQPTVYGGVRQSLRAYHLKSDGDFQSGGFREHAGWELNDEGKVSVELVKGDPAVVNYVARGEGLAVAKAKVYFHQLGHWESPPNFFDPFWRAKLHFFSRDEMGQLLDRVGDSAGRQLINAGAPVEGAGP